MSGTIIRAKHYDETEERLTKDPIVIAMAKGLATTEREEIAHEDGSARFEFMQAANKEYDQRGGDKTQPLHIGAVAAALIKLLDSGAIKTKKVTHFATRSVPGARDEESAAMAYAKIVSGEPSLKEAKKAMAHYMVDEATYLLQNGGGDWAQERADKIFAAIKEMATAEFSGEKDWEALSFDADKIQFQLVRTASDG